MTIGALCHCGKSVMFGYDGDPTHHRGMCETCDAARCDAYPLDCPERLTADALFPEPTPHLVFWDDGVFPAYVRHPDQDSAERHALALAQTMPGVEVGWMEEERS